ncbi:hypothetical protein, partial [Marivirga sp.]|uniref:hypothetical protein n=1 Tax=Marivirga sp. TaxID=2018662 RepID=UPI002D80D600
TLPNLSFNLTVYSLFYFVVNLYCSITSLAKLENELENFQNYSFNSDVSGDEILFDYKLHNAPCHTFNAVPLMRKMGIEIIKNG